MEFEVHRGLKERNRERESIKEDLKRTIERNRRVKIMREMGEGAHTKVKRKERRLQMR